MGSFRAWQLAALSPVIKATVADCWMGTYDGLMVPGNNQLKGQSAWYMNHPGIARMMDYPDVASQAAPRAVYFFAGEEDGLFPKASVEDAFAKMRGVWEAYDAGDKALFHQLDDEFHKIISELSGHGYTWSLIREHKAHMDRVRFLSLSFTANNALEEHEGIVKAIKENDVDAAVEAMRFHLSRIAGIVERIHTTHPGFFETDEK